MDQYHTFTRRGPRHASRLIAANDAYVQAVCHAIVSAIRRPGDTPRYIALFSATAKPCEKKINKNIYNYEEGGVVL